MDDAERGADVAELRFAGSEAPASKGGQMSAVRHPLVAVVVVVTVVALVAAAAFTPRALAQGGSENSCGASNPNIGFPPSVFNKRESGEFGTCGFRNNPNFTPETFPPGHFHE
jgi:hypothetical protein